MNFKNLLSALAFAMTTFAAHAQTAQGPVNIIPTPSKDVIRVIYDEAVDGALSITFTTIDGIESTYKIRGQYPNGVSKKFDVAKINNKPYSVEVKSKYKKAVYQVNPANSRSGFAAQLQTLEDHTILVASKK